MVRGGRGVTVRLVVLLAVAVTAVCYLGFHLLIGRGGALPQASWSALIVLVFMATGVFFAGLPVRRFLRGQSKKTLNPIRAMRTLVLAQATALTGAMVTGWYVAQVLVLLPDAGIASVRTFVIRLAALAAGGVLLVIAGLLAQAMCRVDGGRRDGDQDRDQDDEEEAGASHEH